MNSASHVKLGTNPSAGAFEKLRAEDEPWLEQCFIEPPEFGQLLSDESIIVFGKDGYGKTALCRQLSRCMRDAHEKPTRLLVPWRPMISATGSSEGSGWVRRQAEQALDATALALAQHLAAYPDDFVSAALDTQESLTWFIHRCVLGRPHARLRPLVSPGARGSALLGQILDASPAGVLYADVGPELVIAELLGALRDIGIGGVWIMADDLEGMMGADEVGLVHALNGFLAALGLFEPGGLIFKMFVPSQLESALSRASGVIRRRVTAIQLTWNSARLRRLVEARLAFVMGRSNFTLETLCVDPHLLDWLETGGDTSPREWLDQVRPLVRHYLEHDMATPVDNKTWKALRLANPPRLQLDDESRCLVVGGRDISLDKLPGKAYEMLRYLYEKRGIATKGELYYRVYLGKETIPRAPSDKDYKGPAEYENLIDNYVLRLRKAIEPIPSEPVLLRTVRGHGVELAKRW